MHLFIKILILMALWELGYSNEGEALSNLYKDESFEFVNNSSDDIDIEIFNPDENDGILTSSIYYENTVLTNAIAGSQNTNNGLIYLASSNGVRIYRQTTLLKTITNGSGIYTTTEYVPATNTIYAGRTDIGGVFIDVFDADSETLTTSFQLPGAGLGGTDAIRYDSVNSQIYIVANTFAQMYVYNTSNVLVTTVNTGITPFGLTLDTKRGYVYVEGLFGGLANVSIINGSTNSIIKRISGINPAEHGIYNPDRDLVFIVTDTDDIKVIDASALELSKTITPSGAVGRSGALSYDTDRELVLFPVESGGKVRILVYDNTDAEVQTINITGDINRLGKIGTTNLYDSTNGLFYIGGDKTGADRCIVVQISYKTSRSETFTQIVRSVKSEPIVLKHLMIDASNQQQLQQVFTRKYRSNFGALKEHDIATSAYRSAQNSLPIANLFNLPGEMIVDQNNWFKTTLKANQSFNFTFWYDDWQAEKILRRFEFNKRRGGRG